MSADSFSNNETHFQFEWPAGITGLERIALSCKGDLQRTLSAYFGQPISVVKVWETPAVGPQPPTEAGLPALCASASSTNPLTLTRRVQLLCRGRIVCVCTSTVTMASPDAARLFLEERFAIGQMFRRMCRVPEFELTEVGIGKYWDAPSPKQAPGAPKEGKERIWRRYFLKTEGFECEIEEVFPDRKMFSREEWLTGQVGVTREEKKEVAKRFEYLPAPIKLSS